MKYLYYKLWQLFTKIKTNDMPATNAMIYITLWQFLNLSLLYILFANYSEIESELISKHEIYIISGTVNSILTLLNYLFLYKSRDKIYEKYQVENKKQKLLGNILLALYIGGFYNLNHYCSNNYMYICV